MAVATVAKIVGLMVMSPALAVAAVKRIRLASSPRRRVITRCFAASAILISGTKITLVAEAGNGWDGE
jgi:hypothetical protein